MLIGNENGGLTIVISRGVGSKCRSGPQKELAKPRPSPDWIGLPKIQPGFWTRFGRCLEPSKKGWCHVCRPAWVAVEEASNPMPCPPRRFSDFSSASRLLFVSFSLNYVSSRFFNSVSRWFCLFLQFSLPHDRNDYKSERYHPIYLLQFSIVIYSGFW